MRTLREGITITRDGKKVELASDPSYVEAIARKPSESLRNDERKVLDVMRLRAVKLVEAELHTQLDITELCEYELDLLGEVLRERKQEDRAIFVAYMAAAFYQPGAFELLPDLPEFEEIKYNLQMEKWRNDFELRAKQKLEGISSGRPNNYQDTDCSNRYSVKGSELDRYLG